MACSQSGLIDSGVKVRRNNCKPTARPSHFSQRQMIPVPVRISVNGMRQAGQRSSLPLREPVATAMPAAKFAFPVGLPELALQCVSSMPGEARFGVRLPVRLGRRASCPPNSKATRQAGSLSAESGKMPDLHWLKSGSHLSDWPFLCNFLKSSSELARAPSLFRIRMHLRGMGDRVRQLAVLS